MNLLKIIYWLGVLGALLPLSAFSATCENNCIFNLQDFAAVASEIRSNSSDKAYLAKLKNTTCCYAAGSKWIIKKNPLGLGIAEYVASALYQRILGQDRVGDTVWVHDPDHEAMGTIAVQFKEKFWKFPGSYRPGKNDVRSFEFYDTFLGLWLAGGVAGSALKTPPENPRNKKIKPVEGVELATLASLFLDEMDYEDGWNFALIEKPKAFYVTRYDFDGSLKFLERLGLSKGRNEMGSLSAGFGTPYLLPSWKKLENRHTPFDGAVDGLKMREALEKITSIPFEEISRSVQQSYLEIEPYIQLTSEDFFVTNLESLSKMTVEKLQGRHVALKDMQICLDFELALERNHSDKIQELISDRNPQDLVKLQCTFILKKSLHTKFESGTLASLAKHRNDAGEKLRTFLGSSKL